MYGLAYKLPPHSADGNFVITEDGKELILIDPQGELTTMQAKTLAGKILLALEFWEGHGGAVPTLIQNLQAALVAAGHDPDCPVVHGASADCVPGTCRTITQDARRWEDHGRLKP